MAIQVRRTLLRNLASDIQVRRTQLRNLPMFILVRLGQQQIKINANRVWCEKVWWGKVWWEKVTWEKITWEKVVYHEISQSTNCIKGKYSYSIHHNKRCIQTKYECFKHTYFKFSNDRNKPCIFKICDIKYLIAINAAF